jgi:hypothetical protein
MKNSDYADVLITSMAEMPGLVLTWLLIDRLGRRRSQVESRQPVGGWGLSVGPSAHTDTHTRSRARAHTHTHTHTHTQTHAHRHTHTHTDTHTRVCACVCVLHACQGVFFACVGAVLFLLPTIVDRSNGRAKHSLAQLPCLAIAGSPEVNSKVSCAPEWLRC